MELSNCFGNISAAGLSSIQTPITYRSAAPISQWPYLITLVTYQTCSNLLVAKDPNMHAHVASLPPPLAMRQVYIHLR
jgi:hypothetical protein